MSFGIVVCRFHGGFYNPLMFTCGSMSKRIPFEVPLSIGSVIYRILLIENTPIYLFVIKRLLSFRRHKQQTYSCFDLILTISYSQILPAISFSFQKNIQFSNVESSPKKRSPFKLKKQEKKALYYSLPTIFTFA